MTHLTPREEMAALVEQLYMLSEQLDKPIAFMEVCGTHTVSACRSGVHSLMPENIRLISGPGCPVCVTPQHYIDGLIELGKRPGIILATYGDMLRVTGSGGSLELARSQGAEILVVNSTMDAIDAAKANPNKEVVFAAVGFETTAPATAAAVLAADAQNLTNFSVLPCHKWVIPAMQALLQDPDIRVNGFLCPGHVSVIIGSDVYKPIVEDYKKPCVIGGFEPTQIMAAIVMLTQQIVKGVAQLDNLYPEAVKGVGNPVAMQLLDRVFIPGDSAWRAIGTIPLSGMDLRPEYNAYNAFLKFDLVLGEEVEPPGCRCGEVITGKCMPDDCALFNTVCTPVNPIGPCMVSSEGSCQAWFKYRRNEIKRKHEKHIQPTCN